jgi:hypothetical protein
MPIRINLLAEQQAAEQARRNDPVKRAIWIGSALIFLTLVWTLVLHMEVKAKRSELQNLDLAFKDADEGARVVRNRMAELGDIERRIASLDRYSTNRLLWANALDAFQKVTMDQIRFRNLSAVQRYYTNAATNFFTTNLSVPFDPPAPAWKFWAGHQKQQAALSLASNLFRTFTNAPPFSTNRLPYTVKMNVASTNEAQGVVVVKCEFGLPPVAIEDIDLTLDARDYGNPPGAAIDDFAKRLVTLPYFAQRLGSSDTRMRFVDRPPNPEPDNTEPGSPMFKRFSIRLKYEDRVLTNE